MSGDGSSGQDQSRRNSDGSVTYWHHDRTDGQEIVTEIVYGPDGTEWSREQRRKR